MHKIIVESHEPPQRLDIYLTQKLQLSRTQIQRLIKNHHILVNSQSTKPSYYIKLNDEISYTLPTPTPIELKPQPLPIEILYEDDDIIVVNKPGEILSHPTKKILTGTLLNAVAYHSRLSSIGGPLRCGIVHRLDKETSGVMILAKTDEAHRYLSKCFQEHQVKKEYFAIVWGTPQKTKGKISLPIGYSPCGGLTRVIRGRCCREAITEYEVIGYSPDRVFCALLVRPITGRTHQIRVHLKSIQHPVLSDKIYGKKDNLCSRHALHALNLSIQHPTTKKIHKFHAPLPQDINRLLTQLNINIRLCENPSFK